MKALIIGMSFGLALASPALAAGDADKGKTVFNKCKSCHTIANPEGEVLVKGGRTGPNLYGVIGRQAGTSDFRYSKTLIEAGETGLVWDEALLAAYSADPRGFLKELGTDGRTKMTFKLKTGGEDVAAYLATFGAVVAEEDAEVEADASGESETSSD